MLLSTLKYFTESIYLFNIFIYIFNKYILIYIYIYIIHFNCTNQQPPQCGGAIPGPVWFGLKWLLPFPRVPGTPGTPLYFFAMLPPERLQKGSTQLLQNRSSVFSFSFLLPLSCPSWSPHSPPSFDER